MILMALDHVRDFFHADAFLFDPADLNQTTWPLFFTRFVTHYCAPVFIFLAGTSAFFVGKRLDKKELSVWLLKRGIWLILVELVIIKFAWRFNYDIYFYGFGVIWAIACSMLFLAFVLHLPRKVLIGLCLVGIFGHNLLDGYQPESFRGMWTFLHVRGFATIGEVSFKVVYPLIPWIFVMPLGYHFGALYTEMEQKTRVKWLKMIGVSAIALFFIIRGVNVYGDARPWEVQSSSLFTMLSFFNVSKYPPSLLYLLITLGPSILFLAFSESWKGKFLDKIVVIGRVPMFYYILHIYLIHLLAMLAATLTGFSASSMILDVFVTLSPELKGYGFSLGITYLVWLGLVIGMYPICNWYYNYKKNNRDKWWLSYL